MTKRKGKAKARTFSVLRCSCCDAVFFYEPGGGPAMVHEEGHRLSVCYDGWQLATAISLRKNVETLIEISRVPSRKRKVVK